MDIFSAVSETALITLKARVVESRKQEPVIEDPIAVECFLKLQSLLPTEIRKRILDRKLPLTLTRYIALRARKYDRCTKQFLSEYSDGLVVSLGCGFDTRYWRISKEAWKYVEVDLPNVIEVKKQVLGNIVTSNNRLLRSGRRLDKKNTIDTERACPLSRRRTFYVFAQRQRD